MNILLIGYGAMNQRVARLAEDKGHEIVGVIDRTSKASTPYSQYQHISECKEADVAIDFSNPELLFPLLEEQLSLIHISEPTRREWLSRMPSSA